MSCERPLGTDNWASTCVTRNSSNRAQKSDLNVPTKEWTKVRKERKNFTTRIILTTLKRRPTRRSRRARKLLLALPVVSPAAWLSRPKLLNHSSSTVSRLKNSNCVRRGTCRSQSANIFKSVKGASSYMHR